MNQNVTKFITQLSAHFGKRHDSKEAEQLWLRSMFQNLKGYPATILNQAGDQIISRRDERSFPQIAEIKKVCDGLMRTRQLTVKSPDMAPTDIGFAPEPVRGFKDPAFEASCKRAAEWREEKIKEWGSYDNYLVKTRHISDGR